jgi:protein-tyrosine-phosphatase
MRGATYDRSSVNVLFVCTENAGRSQIAEHLFNASAQGHDHARSAGTRPAEPVHPAVVEVLAARGIDASGARPKPLSDDLIAWADRVVTMGCGDQCPVTGKPTEDWDLPDVAGLPAAEVQEVAVRIAARLAKMLKELGVPAWAGARA